MSENANAAEVLISPKNANSDAADPVTVHMNTPSADPNRSSSVHFSPSFSELKDRIQQMSVKLKFHMLDESEESEGQVEVMLI